MRKVKLQVQMSVDGFVAGPNGEMDWTARNWSDDIKAYVTQVTERVDCIILGRKLAEGFIPHWANVAANPDHPEFTAGQKFTDTRKVVFSQTLDASQWNNAVLAQGNLVDEVTRLKEEDGNDIIAYGGATFVSNLIKHELIDEFHLFVNPVALGEGLAIFNGRDHRQNLTLRQSRAFDCGIVVLNYGLQRG